MKKNNSYNVKLQFSLTKEERIIVQQIQNKGKESVRVIKRARILQLFDQEYTSPTIAEYVGCTPETVRNIGWKYIRHGLNCALYDAPRPGKKRRLSPKEAQKIIALVCSDPPTGRARWTIELIAEEVIKKKIVETVGRETIRIFLHSHDLKPWREKNVVHPGNK